MVGKFTEGAWMVVVAIPLLVWLLLRIQQTYGREVAQLKVQVSQAWPRPSPATRWWCCSRTSTRPP